MNDMEKRVRDSASLALAVILIGLGVLFLADQYLNISVAGYLWPFVVIVPGALLFVYSLTLSAAEGQGFAIFGSMVAMTGLILLFQNVTDLWATWAYAWTLVAPTAVGLGMLLYSSIKGTAQWEREGARLVKIGLGLFLGGLVFFEGMLNLSGVGLNEWFWPLLLICLGGYILFQQLRPRQRS